MSSLHSPTATLILPTDLLCVPEELDLLHVLPEDPVAQLVLLLVLVGLVVGSHEVVEALQAL